jgi:hypothetical protein
MCEEPRQLYAEFPSKVVWNKKTKWNRREKRKDVPRHPASDQKYYMRMLLKLSKDCKWSCRTSYKPACEALGFLDYDREWLECINYASNCATGNHHEVKSPNSCVSHSRKF